MAKGDKLNSLLFFGILLTLTISVGGFNWQNCVLPLMLLIVFFLMNIRKVSMVNLTLGFVLIILMTFSIAYTKGDTQIAIYESEKMLFFIIGLCAANIINEKSLYRSLFFVAAVLAVFGIITFCGGITNNGFVLKISVLPRLQSFLQYANTTACFLGCGYFCFLHEKPDYINTRIYYGLGQAILFAMYLTMSKACIPVFVIILTLYIIKNSNYRQVVVWQNIISLILLLPMAFCAGCNAVILSVAIALVCVLLGAFIPKRVSNSQRMLKIWLFILAIAIVIAILVLSKSRFLSGSFLQRIHFMQDATKMLKSVGLIGHGSGSWRLLQYQFQSFEYVVTYIHNGFLQILVENGPLFFIGFMASIACGLVFAFKNKKYIITAIILLITVHSSIDFDLSYGVMLFILGLFAGIGCGKVSVKAEWSKPVVQKAGALMLCVVLIFSVTYMSCEYILRYSFEKAYVKGDYAIALKNATMLEKICPRDSKLQISLAALEQRLDNNKAIVSERIANATKLSPNDYTLYRTYMKNRRNDEDIRKMCEYYYSLCPQRDDTYIFINEFAKDALNDGIINQEVYNEIINIVVR